MPVNQALVSELSNVDRGGVFWDLNFPDHATPAGINVRCRPVEDSARALGSNLRVVTRWEGVSSRRYGAVLNNYDWQPGFHNVFGSRRDAPMSRVVVGDGVTLEEETVDWVVINVEELNDMYLQGEHPAHLLSRFHADIEMTPPNVVWAGLLDVALKRGLRELARQRRVSRLSGVAGQVATYYHTSSLDRLAEAV